MNLAVEPIRHDFAETLRKHRIAHLHRRAVRTIQVNVGKLCNQACHHCHVDAGPRRSERMNRETADLVVALIRRSANIETVDITGGAPELNENFRFLVESARDADRRVIVRCNLTVLFEPGMHWLPDFYRDNSVELVCSLPCYSEKNVDAQRGHGVFAKSIDALRVLNRLGYGIDGGALALDLVYNPVGAFLPPSEVELEATYHEELRRNFGIEFRHLLTIANMPISRFADQLRRTGAESDYMSLLVNHFNPATLDGLMCRALVSVGYDGALYDCDFNQMLAMPLMLNSKAATLLSIYDLSELAGTPIATGVHCFGCTAGAGSGCSGALT
ncbi:MAG TPA: arsenosugar biosynthesis radical SAM (seleno)protein ArsS [Candidatus Binataceae bacterium]|nr:arsenosugar biosynthesis radical SAM (seleno)protein ArsS [Candidatus Binataceae bacterium]